MTKHIHDCLETILTARCTAGYSRSIWAREKHLLFSLRDGRGRMLARTNARSSDRPERMRGAEHFRQLTEGVSGAYRLFVNLLGASSVH